MTDFRDQLYDKYFQTQSGRRLAAGVEQDLKSHWRQLDAEILPLIPGPKDARVLDLGCGYGSLLMLLKEKGFSNIEGIDISREQVEKAHEFGMPQVQQADAFEFLQNHAGQYDYILGIDIIEHFSKDELVKLLSLIKTALKPGGAVIFRTPNMDAPFASTYAFGDFTHQVFLNYSSAMQLTLSAGMSSVEVLPSHIRVEGFVKGIIRQILWQLLNIESKLILFASGKSTKGVYFTPNLLIRAKK